MARKVRWHTFYPLMMMGLLAGLTLWLQRVANIEPQKNDGNLRHDPDYIVDHMNGKRFDEHGKLQYTLIAERMMHYPDNDSTDLASPRVLYLGRNEPVRITSSRAHVSKDGKVVTLIDNVRLLREPAGDTPEMTLTTSELTVLPDDEFASTAQPVTITQGKSVLHGTGFELNNMTAVAILHSRVRGTLYPRPKQPDNSKAVRLHP